MGKKKGKKPQKTKTPKKSKKDKKPKKGKAEKPDIIAKTKKGKGKKGKGKKGKGTKKAIEASLPVPTQSIHAEPPPPPPPTRQLASVTPSIKDNSLANKYPGILDEGRQMAVVGSECGSYQSLCKLLHAGFRVADRVFAMTPWANYIIVKETKNTKPLYYLYDGCTCNVNRFRYLDLCSGTAGFVYFESMHDVVNYITESRQIHFKMQRIKKGVIDDICKEFCAYGPKHAGGTSCSNNNYF